MRLRLRISRHKLPPANVIWTVAEAANGVPCSVVGFLERVNEIIPLVSSSWGLEDYVVELDGFECLHFRAVTEVFKDEDTVIIRPLETSEYRARQFSGRHQISVAGAHLVDGIPFGRRYIRQPRRPALHIPSRKHRHLTPTESEELTISDDEHDVAVRGMIEEGTVDETVESHEAASTLGKRKRPDSLKSVRFDTATALFGSEDDEDEEDDLDFELDSPALTGLSQNSQNSENEPSSLLSETESDLSSSESSATTSSSSSSDDSDDSDDSDGSLSSLVASLSRRSQAVREKIPTNNAATPTATTSAKSKTPQQMEKGTVLKQETTKIPQPVASTHTLPGAGKPETQSRNARKRDSRRLRQLKDEGLIHPDATISDMKTGGICRPRNEIANTAHTTSSITPSTTGLESDPEERSKTEPHKDIDEEKETEGMNDVSDDVASEAPSEEPIVKPQDAAMTVALSSRNSESSITKKDKKKDKATDMDAIEGGAEGVKPQESKSAQIPEEAAGADGKGKKKKKDKKERAKKEKFKPDSQEKPADHSPTANGSLVADGVSVDDSHLHDVADSSAMAILEPQIVTRSRKSRDGSTHDFELSGSNASIVNGETPIERTPLVTPLSKAVEAGKSFAVPTSSSPEESAPKRSRLDIAGSRRLLFGSLGIRTPKTPEEEKEARAKLAAQAQRPGLAKLKQKLDVETAATTPGAESEPPVDPHSDEWKKKIDLDAVECVDEGIELSTPPYPFRNLWDPQYEGWHSQSKKSKKRKRNTRNSYGDDHDAYGPGTGPGTDYADEPPDNSLHYNDDYNDDHNEYYDDAEPAPHLQGPAADHEETVKVTRVRGDFSIPTVPRHVAKYPVLKKAHLSPGTIVLFKQLDCSEATKWAPTISDYRSARIEAVEADGTVVLRLAANYVPRTTKRFVGGKRVFSGFEDVEADEEEEEEDEGVREVVFEELLEARLLKGGRAVDDGLAHQGNVQVPGAMSDKAAVTAEGDEVPMDGAGTDGIAVTPMLETAA
ncbi:hypothetical protein P152DRAFT_513085 [Eremomyces bilateralis CBS 781.70]|uniref:DUF7357 domain-containing protein n=1 Tax=Eremomyces bilateralis CBS 781.70 TaxID=1392243 RepID=A0A6G1G780_9PEZI|nr:uncharacterized protein P152DRAFT_513085 [Eremomyces bilateralis CBS 781.70]KAF1813689.1 hypothetical protein P152DRAFT_513085 [Eremomyces bilateralis CBS 781.70]